MGNSTIVSYFMKIGKVLRPLRQLAEIGDLTFPLQPYGGGGRFWLILLGNFMDQLFASGLNSENMFNIEII